MSIKDPIYPTSVWDGLSGSREDRIDDESPSFRDWDQATAEIISLQSELDLEKAKTASGHTFSKVNGNAGTLVAGTPVYIDGSDEFDKADADAAGVIRDAVGIITVDVATAVAGIAQVDGIATLTTGEWDAVAGTTGGLTPGVKYYLSDVAGTLVATPPATAGDDLLVVVKGLSATQGLLVLDSEGVV